MPSRETLNKLLVAAYDGQALIGAVGVFLLILLQVPWLADVAAKVGLEDTDEFRTIVIGMVLLAVLSQLRDIQDTVKDQAQSARHFSDPRDMYDALLGDAETITNPEQKHLDVLALTLYSAWPNLSFWLQTPAASSWHLRLATLGADADPRWIPNGWPAESDANIAAAEQFANRPEAVRRGITISVSTYDFTPGVHGFRLGNGDIYISNVLWDHDGLIGKNGFTYRFVPHTDSSAAADAARALFDSWFMRAFAGVPAKA